MIRLNPRDPRGIVWLASYPKSGNTWLRAFLYHIVRLQNRRADAGADVNEIHRVSKWEAKLDQPFAQVLGKPIEAASQSEIMRARAVVQAAIARQAGGVVFLKTHNVFGEYEGSATINPAVTIGGIYLVRDPRDIAQSLARHNASSIDEAIDLMNMENCTTAPEAGVFEVWGSWSQNVQSWAGGRNPSLLVLRYEDILDDPAKGLTAVVKHLRSGASRAQIAKAIDLSTFDKLQRQETERGFNGRSVKADRFFAIGKAGTWREALTAAQVERIVSAHGKTMKQFGYLD